MSKVAILENLEIELGKVRGIASRVDNQLILYLIDMAILATKREAISEDIDRALTRPRSSRRMHERALQ
jgi:hypothetical protein